MNLLWKIEKSELFPDDLQYFQLAFKNRRITKKGLYTHLGKVPTPDICVQIADFFNRVHGLGWVFVSGVWEKTVIVILRNDGDRKDAGKLANKAFGRLGAVGGHPGAARVEIPIEAVRAKGVGGYCLKLERFLRWCLRF